MNKLLSMLFVITLITGCSTKQSTVTEQKCIYKDEIKVTTNINVEETRINNLYSVDLDNRQRKCIADVSVKIKQWHRLEGEYIYGTNISEDEACKNAKRNAMEKFVGNNFNSLVTNIQLINCSEVQADRESFEINVEKQLPDKEWLSIWNSMDGKTKDDIITSMFLLIF